MSSEITNDKLFEILMKIQGELGQQTGMLKGLEVAVGDEKLRVRGSELAIEGRLRSIEHKVYGVSTAAGILGVVAGYLGFHIKI